MFSQNSRLKYIYYFTSKIIYPLYNNTVSDIKYILYSINYNVVPNILHIIICITQYIIIVRLQCDTNDNNLYKIIQAVLLLLYITLIV